MSGTTQHPGLSEQGHESLLAHWMDTLALAFADEAARHYRRAKRVEILQQGRQLALAATLVRNGTWSALVADAWLDTARDMLVAHRRDRIRATHTR